MNFDIKRVISVAAILTGTYYMLVALGVLTQRITWLNFRTPSDFEVFIVGAVIFIIGIWMALRAKIKKKLAQKEARTQTKID